MQLSSMTAFYVFVGVGASLCILHTRQLGVFIAFLAIASFIVILANGMLLYAHDGVDDIWLAVARQTTNFVLGFVGIELARVAFWPSGFAPWRPTAEN